MDRRNFLKSAGLIAGAMYINLPAFAEKVRIFGEPRLRIGILSDIHIWDEASVRIWEHALEYFRDRKVDGVLVAGDLADWGLEPQLKMVADAWYRVFPKDKLPDGKHVEKLFIYGNHDVEAHTYGDAEEAGYPHEKVLKEAIANAKEKIWKKLFHEDYSPIYMKTVKGYRFIGAHWYIWDKPTGVPEFLEKNRALLEGDKPFFYFQHPHPKNTCNGPEAWGHDMGEVPSALSKYPNAIAFSGHSHMPLTDDRDLWQDSFTSIGTASLSYQYLMGARENSQVDGENTTPSQMPMIGARDGKQGMVMTVYDDYVTFERREFMYDQSLGDDWVLPIPKSNTRPLTFENRAGTAPVPQFGKNAKVKVEKIENGHDRFGVELPQVRVSFPSVLKKRNGVRAFDYEVQIEQRYVDVLSVMCTKRVYSNGCYLGEDKDEADVECLFSVNELPKLHPYHFVVRPCNCYSRKGEPIYSQWMEPSGTK